MDTVIVAFESEKSCHHVREVLESAGAASCLICRSAAEVKRAVRQQQVAAVVCGYKFADQTAETLFQDLPMDCAMLMLARQDLLDLCGEEGIVKLAAPAARGELLAAVQALLQMARRLERFVVRPRRSREDAELIQAAKEALMERFSLSEEAAHRYLQKRSMDTGAKLVDTARAVLAGH